MITIIDYGMGNLASVQKAFARVGVPTRLTQNPHDVELADKLILPGVGAFGAAMNNLNALRLVDPIRRYCETGRPFLGICLGMQLLMSRSNEMGDWEGLGIVAGRVGRFFEDSQAPENIKVPHMGWNTLEAPKRCGLLDEVQAGSSVYFVHSYYVIPACEDVVAATSTHGEAFCAALAAGNIFATQFHPEKSGNVGLSILSAFAAL